MKTFQYFQPEYVSKFKCDGSKCNARCCKDWTIIIDDATYKKYSRIKPKDKAKEITSHMKIDSKRGQYVVSLIKTFEIKNIDSEKRQYLATPGNNSPCPFLNEDNLCKLQLEYGEEYLSVTCSTYPRRTYAVGKFFERSLTLTCPVAAELILFNEEPMKFEFVDVPDKLHSKHGRIRIQRLPVVDDEDELACEVQITMISILQERRFSIDQRLIVLGLFLDKLQEYKTGNPDSEVLLNLVAVYRSEEFLMQELLPLVQSFTFDANKFMPFMLKFIGYTLDCLKAKNGYKFFNAFTKTLGIKPDENNEVGISETTANYERLVDSHKEFVDKYSSFFENYLINELFLNFYPWRFDKESFTKNFAVFLISYKIFELITFATVHSGLNSKEDLLAMVDWFMTRTDHNPDLYNRFLKLLEGIDDTYILMVTLL